MFLLVILNKERDRDMHTASQKNMAQIRELSAGEGKMHVHCQE